AVAQGLAVVGAVLRDAGVGRAVTPAVALNRVAADVASLGAFDTGLRGWVTVGGPRGCGCEQAEDQRPAGDPGEAPRGSHCERASSVAHWLSQVSLKLTVVGIAKVLAP